MSMFRDLFSPATFAPLLDALHYVVIAAPLWVPLFLGIFFFNQWMDYIRVREITKAKKVLLEVNIPRETNKSPRAMELVFTGLWQKGYGTLYEVFKEGKYRPWFSFEIVSIGGDLHFFIWTEEKYKGLIESLIYAQYPDVEVYEVPDYTTSVQYNGGERFVWGTHHALTNPDVYPIKTYVDYSLDVGSEPKEEQKIDPMTPMLEYLGNLSAGEQAWVQILIQAHSKEGTGEGRIIKKPDWKDEAKEEIKKLREEAMVKQESGEQKFSFPLMTKGVQNKIESIERSLDKFPFNAMIRSMYIAEWDHFNPSNIGGLIGSTRQYNSNNLNGFRLSGISDFSQNTKALFSLLKIPERLTKPRKDSMIEEVLMAYKRRSFFYPPHKETLDAKPFILNTEELATIYHFPGGVAQTPTFKRIESKKAEPPSNLPT